jgi:hypothetical protein
MNRKSNLYARWSKIDIPRSVSSPCLFKIWPIAIASCFLSLFPNLRRPSHSRLWFRHVGMSQISHNILPSLHRLASQCLLRNTVSGFSLCGAACVRKYDGIYRHAKAGAITYCWRAHNCVPLQDGGFALLLQDLLRCKDQSCQCILCSYYGNVIFNTFFGKLHFKLLWKVMKMCVSQLFGKESGSVWLMVNGMPYSTITSFTQRMSPFGCLKLSVTDLQLIRNKHLPMWHSPLEAIWQATFRYSTSEKFVRIFNFIWKSKMKKPKFRYKIWYFHIYYNKQNKLRGI